MHLKGIDSVILETRNHEYVIDRVRAAGKAIAAHYCKGTNCASSLTLDYITSSRGRSYEPRGKLRGVADGHRHLAGALELLNEPAQHRWDVVAPPQPDKIGMAWSPGKLPIHASAHFQVLLKRLRDQGDSDLSGH